MLIKKKKKKIYLYLPYIIFYLFNYNFDSWDIAWEIYLYYNN